MRIGDPLFELNSATVIRRGVPILDGVTLSVGAGEHTAVLGPNGSGKSTLIKLLTYQLYPLANPEGPPPVRVLGRDRWNVTELRSHLGIVSAEVQDRFVSGSSMGCVRGLDAVVAGFFSSDLLFFHHRVEGWMRRRAAVALERVGAGELAERWMNEMSTGEVRRVLIARSLVHEPEVLVLDEPTAGLDLVARDDFLSRLRTLADGGTTLILVTHHVEEIIPEIGRIVLLTAGRVAADGPPGAVLTAPIISAAYGSAVEVREVGNRYEMRLAGMNTEVAAGR